MLRLHLCRLALLLTPTLIACDTKEGEGETGSGETGTANETGENLGDGCGEETTTILTDLDAPPPTFDQSVNALLADVTGDYAGTFGWFEPDGFIAVTHAGTSSPLSMGIAYEGGEVRLIEVEEHGNFPGGQLGGFPCSNRLEIDAQLLFATEDGLFDESFTTTLSLAALDYGVGDPQPGLSLSHELDFATLNGSLSAEDFVIEDAQLNRVILQASFEGEGASGSLNTEIESTELGWVGFGPVASFQAYLGDANSICGSCEPGEYCQAGPDANTCTPLPDACTDAPDCDCLEANTCPGFLTCLPGEVFTVSCEG